MPLTVGTIEVIQRPTVPPEKDPNYAGLRSETLRLPSGHKKTDNHAAFQAETIFESDFPIVLRDGCRLRADIFRPTTSENTGGKVPAIIAWSPYGKMGTGINALDITPGRVGVPQSRLSGYEKFEGPDPAEWTARGYAICNIDSRGVFNSEGDIRMLGTAEAQDGYDAIEYLSQLPWCNGKVAMAGNSWLAMAQWFIAAERPPHLACIAPFEGLSDFYRESLARGGVPSDGFIRFVEGSFRGRGQQESAADMMAKYPLWNEYWEDKRAKLDKINVPAYILASFSTLLHTEGSFRGFEEIPSPTWLRVHPYQEWYDLYEPQTNLELQQFFDRYTKGIENGWESTPRVRVSILRFNENPIINHVFPSWPIPSTSYRTLHLQSNKTLSLTAASGDETASYQSDVKAFQSDEDPEELVFEYTFNSPAHLVGYLKATLYVSFPDHDDGDVYVQVRKASPTGKLLQNINIPLEALGFPTAAEVPSVNPLKYLGPQGICRASLRELDPQLSKPYHGVFSHKNPRKVTPGQVVELEIPIWPTAIAFEKGEKLCIKVSGHSMVLAEFEMLKGTFTSGNKGRHVLHMGSTYDSRIEVPFVEL